MSNIGWKNSLDKPSVKDTVIVEARCECGYFRQEFEADRGWAYENWIIAQTILFEKASRWEKELNCQCEK